MKRFKVRLKRIIKPHRIPHLLVKTLWRTLAAPNIDYPEEKVKYLIDKSLPYIRKLTNRKKHH